MEKFIVRFLKLKWLIISAVLIITLLLGYQIRNISIDSDVLNSMDKSDSTAQVFYSVGKEFGGNDIGMVVLETNDIFNTSVLEHVKLITDSIKLTKGVSTVTSITNILDIKSSEWGIEIGNLIDENNLPQTQAELDSIKTYTFSREMYKGSIVSDDGTATIIAFTLLHDADKQVVAKEIKRKISAMNLSEKIYFGGLPFMLNDITELIISDIIILLPVIFIIIVLILFLSFKSLRGVFLPLLTAGISVIWTLGFMALLGFKITLTSSYIPVVLLAVGTAYTIHVLNSFNQNKSKDRKQALIQALIYTMIPVILAAVTTMIGFVSFIFGSYLQMITEFGIFTALGTFIALLLSIFFVPALISAFSLYGKNPEQTAERKSPVLNKIIINPISRIIIKHPKYTMAVWTAMLLISIGGIFMIKTSVNITNYFKKDNPVRVTEDLMQKKFGGSFPVFVVFEGDMQSPDVLKMMIKTEHFMKLNPNISITQSVADLVEQMNDAMGEGKSIPIERAKIEQLWFLLEGQDIMPQLVSEDLQKGVIQSKFASIETQEISSFVEQMNKFIEENKSGAYKIKFTGIPSIYCKLNDSLVKSQYSSLAIAIVLVLIIVGLLLRSFKKGVFATIPIITTICILLGFMGITGIPLDIATVLVGSIALGIGIDYSIHIISGFNVHFKVKENAEEAIKATLMISGKAVIINAISVAAGFLVLCFAHMVPFQNFGLLVAINMFGSGIGALTLLPVILILAERKKKKTLIKS